MAIASDYGTTGLIDIPTARFDKDGLVLLPVLRPMNATNNSRLPIRPRHGSRERSDIPVLMISFTGTETTNSKRDYGRRSFTCLRWLLVFVTWSGPVSLVLNMWLRASSLGSTDFTLGLGWGRLAGERYLSNPLTRIDDRFAVRSAETGLGGELSFGNFFSGRDVGVFGGISHKFESFLLLQCSSTTQISTTGIRDEAVIVQNQPWSVG